MTTRNRAASYYALFRWIFAAYLFAHFAHLVPWAAETFSSSGMLAERTASPLIHLFPNLLAIADGPWMTTVFVASAAAAALAFGAGVYDRVAAVWMWYVLACLFGRNPLTANPSLPFVGWMLIAHLFVPPLGSARLASDGREIEWKLPAEVFRAAWIVMSLAYTYSGYTKLMSPGWLDGSALAAVLANPLARPGPFRDAMLALPSSFLALATWGALALELLFAPLALAGGARPYVWTAMLLMHFGLMALVDFADLSLGMVMLHLFTLDPRWLARPPHGPGEPARSSA